MKRFAMQAGALLLAIILLVGCSPRTNAPSEPTPSPSTEPQLSYTNLAQEASQAQTAQRLQAHGVSSEQTDVLLSWVDDFNARVTSGSLAKDFEPMEESGPDYQGLIVEPKEAADGWLYPEANCRLTSYLLLRDRLHTNGTYEEGDTFLMFDVEAIDTYEPFGMSEQERSQFMSLFGWVPVEGDDTVQAHAKRIQQAWKKREIKIEGEGISLITVYLHSPLEQVRFVGHTGVLLEDKEGLLFVEKYGPQFPFQVTKLQNREQLKRYLLGRKDLYGDETELEPILLENDQLL